MTNTKGKEISRSVRNLFLNGHNGARNKFFIFIVIILFFFNNSASINAKDFTFADAEKLELSLRWNGLIGGKSTIDFKEIPLPDLEQKSYLFQSQLKTVGLADILFRIRNEYSTLVMFDSRKISPIWWKVKQQEKNYKYEEKTDFAEFLQKESDLQNPLSALFLIRLKKWEVGESITVPVLVQKEIYPVKVQAISREPLKIYGKTFDTILIDVATENVKLGISSTKISDIKIWLTDDDKKLPILMKANTAVGLITVLLDNREELLKTN